MTRTRIRTLPVVMAALLGVASSAQAQAPADNGIGIRGLFSFGITQVGAPESFEAVTGNTQLSNLGGGAQVTNLWRGVFAEVSFDRSTTAGERVFIHEGTVFPLGIPIDISMNALDVIGGWRFVNNSRVTPYAGAGYSLMGYKETADFAQPGDDVDDSGTGAVVAGGVELRIARWIHVVGDVRYRAVSGALGNGGVSAEFGEEALGGLSFGMRVAVGR
jgi:hypothetical protein